MATSDNELAYELLPFIKVYKNGRVERLFGDEIVPPSLEPKDGVLSKDIMVSPENVVSARIYIPQTTKSHQKFPILVYFHGGGFFTQTPFSPTYQDFLNYLVVDANVVLVSIHYRRAPEHPLPIAYDDSWAALKWIASHSNGNGQEVWLNDYVDFDHMFFVGDSAGANIAHNMAIRAGSEKTGGVKFDGLVLMHPYFWGKDPVGDEATDKDERAYVERYWIMACPTTRGSDDPLINPAKDPRLSALGCAKVLIFVAGSDFLKYRAWYYYKTLAKSGWKGALEIVESEGEEHVFHLYRPNCEKAIDIVKKMVSFIHMDRSSGPK